MKKILRGYYGIDFDELWKNCIFIFDANALLDIYHYSQASQDRIIEILTKISDRIWIPHQVGLEYHRNRRGRIMQEANEYDNLRQDLNDSKTALISVYNNTDVKLDQIRNRLESKIAEQIEIFNKIKKYLALPKDISDAFAEIEKIIEEAKIKYPTLTDEDPIKNKIAYLFDNKIGSSYPVEKLEEIFRIGKMRYDQEIPPGYKDKKKENEKGEKRYKYREYGDLVIWCQIIDYARSIKKPVILITNNKKEDWWSIVEGEKEGPRPELINEFYNKVGMDFYMYRLERFMEFAESKLKVKVGQNIINEIRESQIQEKHLLRWIPVTCVKCRAYNYVEEIRIFADGKYRIKPYRCVKCGELNDLDFLEQEEFKEILEEKNLEFLQYKDEPTQEDEKQKRMWYHIKVKTNEPSKVYLQCMARVDFLDKTTRIPLAPQIMAHWTSQPTPIDNGKFNASKIPTCQRMDIGFREEMIDILIKYEGDYHIFVADPWVVYRYENQKEKWENIKISAQEILIRVEIDSLNLEKKEAAEYLLKNLGTKKGDVIIEKLK